MVASFLKKIMILRQIDFSKGSFRIFDYYGIIIPMEVLIDLYDNTKNKQLFFNAGYAQGEQGTNMYLNKFGIKREKVIYYAAETASVLGFGKPEIIKMDLKNKKFIIRLNKNLFAETYKKNQGVLKSAVDDYFAGIISGVCSTIFKTKLKCKETKCIAKGDSCCEFVYG